MRSSGVSQRKKLEEQNAQAIRKLLTEPANKHCFECGQRGPTYVNLTNGSYCCMHCSGLLRGLHPPHRVKSISMSTFTTEEVERLKTLGNAVNASIFLGLYDGKKQFEPRIDDEVKAHLIDKYENRRWYVSPSDVERQKQLLEEHAAHRRNSLSAVSLVSQKSNQSAPPNLHPPQTSAKSGPIDLLTGDLFDLSLSFTPVQPSAPTSSAQPIKLADLQSPQDDWSDLFTKPIDVPETSSFSLNPSTVPPILQFPMPSIPPPKPKEHATGLFSSATDSADTPIAFQQQWESFTGFMPKSATVTGIPSSAPHATTALDELFSNFDVQQSNGGTIPFVIKSVEQSNFGTNFDGPALQQPSTLNNGASVKTQQTSKMTDNWNPFLS